MSCICFFLCDITQQRKTLRYKYKKGVFSDGSLIRGTSVNPRLCDGVVPIVRLVVATKKIATAA